MHSVFCFKRFAVRQESSSMKVNTDAVLLGAWAGIPSGNEPFFFLDIGTGTGVIALMIAQRLSDLKLNFRATAIDPDHNSINESAFNFANSPWASSLSAKEMTLEEFMLMEKGDCFDIIVTNPPFFSNSLKSPSLRKSASRHNDILPFSTIVKASEYLLKQDGKLSLILPEEERLHFMSEINKAAVASAPSLFLTRICQVKTLPCKEAKRALMEFTKFPADKSVMDVGGIIREELCIYNSDRTSKSMEYEKLIGDFYLE